jgi:hypothetical protein
VFGTFLYVSAFASYWLEDCANFPPTPEEQPIQRQTLLDQANLLLSMDNYTPLADSRKISSKHF